MAEIKDGILLLEDIHEAKDEKRPPKEKVKFTRKAAWN